jgi:hypothetical protein
MAGDFGPHLDENLSIVELGQHFGRGLAEADAGTFEAILLGSADRLLHELADAGEEMGFSRAQVEQFVTAARAEWVRVSTAIKHMAPGRA